MDDDWQHIKDGEIRGITKNHKEDGYKSSLEEQKYHFLLMTNQRLKFISRSKLIK